jgi:hypothetical protein
MWLAEYHSFSAVSTNQRLRQFFLFEPHFMRYPDTIDLLESFAVTVDFDGEDPTPCVRLVDVVMSGRC